MDNLPRPPRSLRDRNSSLNQQNISNDNISNPSPSNYLEEMESKQSEQINNINIEEEKDDPIVEDNKKEKPKVTVLNVRKNSTKELKEKLEKEKEIEYKNKELNDSIKRELKRVEEVVEEAKEEITKVRQKTFEKINETGKRIVTFAIETSEKIVDKSKEIIMAVVFKKKITKKTLIKYSDLIQKNIEFLDYQSKPLVKGIDINSPNFEKIFLSNVIKDIKFCERFVKNIQPNTEGIYANRNLSDIFKNIKDKDIYTFVEYIYDNPENFIGQKYKFSEAFATWIIKKSHEI